jgi:hypothetical protein
MEQRIRFCAASGKARIDFPTLRAGLPPVKTAHCLTHIEHGGNSPSGGIG